MRCFTTPEALEYQLELDRRELFEEEREALEAEYVQFETDLQNDIKKFQKANQEVLKAAKDALASLSQKNKK